jgi:hypothetical protein
MVEPPRIPSARLEGSGTVAGRRARKAGEDIPVSKTEPEPHRVNFSIEPFTPLPTLATNRLPAESKTSPQAHYRLSVLKRAARQRPGTSRGRRPGGRDR